MLRDHRSLIDALLLILYHHIIFQSVVSADLVAIQTYNQTLKAQLPALRAE